MAMRMLLRAERGSLLGWTIGLGLITLLTMLSFPAIEGNEEYDQLWQNLPESARNLFGGVDSITDLPGFLDSQLLSYLPLLFGIYAVMHMGRVLAGEEEAGRLDLWLSTPMSRIRWALLQVGTLVVVQLALAVILGVILVIGALAIGNQDVAYWWLVLAGVDALPASLFFGAAAFLASGHLHRRGPVTMAGTGVLLATFFIGALAPLAAGLDPLKYVSPFFHYGRSRPLSGEFDVVYYVLWLSLALLLFVAGMLRFDQKDLTG